MPLDAPTLGLSAVGDGRLLLAAEDGFKLLGKGAKSLEASLAPGDCVDKAKRFEAGAVDGAVAAAAAGERVALARASGDTLAKFAEATCDLDVAAVALRHVGDALYLAAATSGPSAATRRRSTSRGTPSGGPSPSLCSRAATSPSAPSTAASSSSATRRGTSPSATGRASSCRTARRRSRRPARRASS